MEEEDIPILLEKQIEVYEKQMEEDEAYLEELSNKINLDITYLK